MGTDLEFVRRMGKRFAALATAEELPDVYRYFDFAETSALIVEHQLRVSGDSVVWQAWTKGVEHTGTDVSLHTAVRAVENQIEGARDE